MSLDEINKKIGNTIIEHTHDTVFTLYNDNILRADNFERIDFLSDTAIKIKTSGGTLIIMGKNLVFDSLTRDFAQISGIITSLEIEGVNVEKS